MSTKQRSDSKKKRSRKEGYVPVLVLIQRQPFQLSTWIRQFISKPASTKKTKQGHKDSLITI
jgi:hypothetical protein